jgi:hypothetical protein
MLCRRTPQYLQYRFQRKMQPFRSATRRSRTRGDQGSRGSVALDNNPDEDVFAQQKKHSEVIMRVVVISIAAVFLVTLYILMQDG